jgi:UDP-glucose:(heptosyl)LPS alpha-1,3-glucosyltransferase
VTEVALLAEALDPARGGGAERAIRATARALARAGARVLLYAPADRLGPLLEGAELVGVEIASRSRAGRAREISLELSRRARSDAPGATLVALGKILGADLVWSHGGVHAASRRASASAGRSRAGGLLARAARALRPVESVFDAIERGNAESAARGELRIVALSERVRRDLAELHACDPSSVSIVRNGIDLARFEVSSEERSAAREHLARLTKKAPGESVAAFVGHAFFLKGLDRAIRSLRHAKRPKLVVFGRGDTRPFLDLGRREGVADRVFFQGDATGLDRLLPGADMVVHPSRYDPCSLVVLEALAAGVPVVASRADGSSEIVGKDAGFVLEDPDDPRELASRIDELSSGGEVFRSGARASARSIESCARELLDLVASRPRGRVKTAPP